MTAEHLTQCLLHQMGRTVVICCQISLFFIHREFYGFTFFDNTLCHTSNMSNLRSLKFDDIFNNKCTICPFNHTGICHLATHCGIHRGLFYKNRSLFAFFQLINNGIFGCQNCNLRLMYQTVIADKFTFDRSINGLINRNIFSHVIGCLSGITCRLTLVFHRLFETIFINRKSFFL